MRADYDDGDPGTSAHVYRDRDWLYIITDPYEGVVMLHIEALPQLQEALEKIAREPIVAPV